MADEWKELPLGDIVDFQSGGTPSKSNPDYWNGTVPWVSAKDMKMLRLRDTEDHLTSLAVEKSAKLVQAGTVLLLTRGMTLLNDVPICIIDRPMAFNQDVKALHPKNGLTPEYLSYLLLGTKARLLDMVDLAGHGTGRLNTAELKILRINLPKKSEQRAIAHILGTLDDKIELNRRMNATLEGMARALFKSWFVDFEPVRAKMEGCDPNLPPHIANLFPDRLVDSELGEIPEGWEVHPLDKIAHFLNGLALQKFPAEGDDYLPVIKIVQLRKGNTDGADRASANIDEKYIVRDGDILFSWSGSLEVVVWAGGPGALNQHLFKVTSDAYPDWFILQWLYEHLNHFRHIAAGKATTMGHIQRRHLTDAKVAVPPTELLAAAGSILGPIGARGLQSRLESRTLAALRDALLPKLISGELRVPQAERMAEKARA